MEDQTHYEHEPQTKENLKKLKLSKYSLIFGMLAIFIIIYIYILIPHFGSYWVFEIFIVSIIFSLFGIITGLKSYKIKFGIIGLLLSILSIVIYFILITIAIMGS